MHNLVMPKANVSFSRGPLSELFIDLWHWSVHFLRRASGTQPEQAKQTLLLSFLLHRICSSLFAYMICILLTFCYGSHKKNTVQQF